MVKILVGNRNIQEFNFLCPKLTNDKNYKIENVTTGKETLVAYPKLNPDILVLDDNLQDICMEEIIEKLSYDPIEQKNCNTILTVSNDYILKLQKIAKIYEILYKPIHNELNDIIEYLTFDLNTPNIEKIEVEELLVSLHFNGLSNRF